MSILKERPFVQDFDIILTQERLTLDIEKDKYPDDKVCFYLNGSTGEISTNLEDVVRQGKKHCEYSHKKWLQTERHISVQYDDEQKLIFFHLLTRTSPNHLRRGNRVNFHEFDRFAVDKDLHIYRKEDGLDVNPRQDHPYIGYSCDKNVKENGEYVRHYVSKEHLPFSPKHFEQLFDGYINSENGSQKGMLSVMQHLFPPVYNTSGNKYNVMNSYQSFFEYVGVMQNGITCIKKTGKKQDYIDKMIDLGLPEIDLEKMNLDKYEKWAVIQKVEGASEPTCCVRTMTYVEDEDVSFEGGRIYISKKSVEFCKINNIGEWVHQPLLSKPDNWTFSIEEFSEDETQGTMLEYFGHIVKDIDPSFRALAIFTFIKYPMLESLAKLSSAAFINRYFELLEDVNDVNKVLNDSLGISLCSTKVLQSLGVNNAQFELLKDKLCEGMPDMYFETKDNSYVLPYGLIPILKFLLIGDRNGDISSIDLKKFETYLDFCYDSFTGYTISPSRTRDLSLMMGSIMDWHESLLYHFPDMRPERMFPLYSCFLKSALEHGYEPNAYYDETNNKARIMKDYISMLNRVEDIRYFRPVLVTDFNSLELMHDNIQIAIQVSNDSWKEKAFKERYEKFWEKLEFNQEEKKDKDGIVKQEELPFIVISPKTPYELAREGTMLHHCVSNYIDRVAEGQTNILFIRKREAPTEPFFTVEVSNEKTIEQVHGLQNRNADTEHGMEQFVHLWATKKRLKIHGYNKRR